MSGPTPSRARSTAGPSAASAPPPPTACPSTPAPAGGVVAFANPACRPRLEALRDRVLRARRRRCPGRPEPAGRRAGALPRPPGPAGRYLRRTLGLTERSAYRMPLRGPAAGAGRRGRAPAGPVRAVRSSSRVGILSVLAVAPHAHATLDARALRSCHGWLPLRASSSRVS